MKKDFENIFSKSILEKFKKYYLQSSLVFLILIIAGVAFYFYNKAITKTPQQAANEEALAVIVKVGRLMLLPENEQPTVATVSDPDKLKNQLFFSNAKKGDKVLIYTNAKKAILYDPVGDIVVNVAPISIGAPPENKVKK